MRTGMLHRSSRGTRILGLAAVIVAIAACSSGAERVLSNVGNSVGPEPAAGEQAFPAANPSPAASAAADTLGSTTTGGGTAALFKEDAKIVRTGSMSLQVADLDKALGKAADSIRALGGYIGASTQSNNGDSPTATITYRIPVGSWDQGLSALRGLATKVLSEKTDAVEVTSQMVDLAARIKNLQASEQALQAIMVKATKISDILEVQGQLTDVRGQIEQLQAQQALLTDQTSFGTMTVTMGPQVVAVTQAAKQWDPGTEVDRAAATLVDILQGLASAGIWFGIVWLPILLVLAIAALVVALVLRRTGFRGRRRPDEPPTMPTPEAAG